MAHLVLGYPTLQTSIRTAEQYIAAGCAILELQVPFSHPTADGAVITEACRVAALDQGVSMSDCLQAIEFLRKKYPSQEIMVMSYANRLYNFGLERFRSEMERLEVSRLIIPDLPVDSVLIPASRRVQLVPVLAANVTDARLECLLGLGCDFFYLMSDFKITGGTFSLHPRLAQLATRIRLANPAARIGIGFGIETPEQVKAVLEVADYAIIGSALIRAQKEGRLDQYLAVLKNMPRFTTQRV